MSATTGPVVVRPPGPPGPIPPGPGRDRRGPDRLCRLAVIASASWVWWAGSVLGTLLGLAVLWRFRRPGGDQGRRWGWVAVTLGAVGLATLPFIGVAWARMVARHVSPPRGPAALWAVAGAADGPGGAPTASRPAAWMLPGGSGARVVGPTSASTGPGVVSAEVWRVGRGVVPGRGAVLYAAALDDDGGCWFLRATAGGHAVSVPAGGGTAPPPCTADAARVLDWRSAGGASAG